MCFSVTTFSINLFVGNEFEWIFFHNVPRAVYDTHTHTHIYIRRIAFELQSKVLRRVTSHRGWASEISGICQLQRERREEWKTGGECWRAREILRLLIWIANGRNDSLCPPSDRMKLFRETPLELASSSSTSVCLRVCVSTCVCSLLPLPPSN